MAAHRWIDHDPAQCALRIYQPWLHAPLVSDQLPIAFAQHVMRPQIKVVDVEVCTILFDNEHLLPQAQHGIEAQRVNLWKCKRLPLQAH
jgi:hypothetical protein